MAGISMAMLRRALAEMADRGVGRGMMSDAGEAGANMLRASGSGASLGALGGVAMNAPDDSRNEDLYGYSDRLMRGIGTGALVGAGLGAGAVGFMGARGAASALRRALAEAAAERGAGRAATRDVGHVEDAVRFHTANEGDDVAMRGQHAEPDAMEPDADVDDAAGMMRGGANPMVQRARIGLNQAFPTEAAQIDRMSDDEILDAASRLALAPRR